MTRKSIALIVGAVALVAFAAILAVYQRRPPDPYAQGGEIGDCAAGEIGLMANGALVVITTKPGSAAEAAGVQPGDRLETLNGVRFDSQRDAIFEILFDLSPCEARQQFEYYQAASPDSAATATPRALTATLVVSRAGAPLTFTVDLANEPDTEYGKSGYTGPGDSYGATHTPMPVGVTFVY